MSKSDEILERVTRVETKLETMEKTQEDLTGQIIKLVSLVNKARGAFILIIGIGGILTWLIAQWDNIRKVFT